MSVLVVILSGVESNHGTGPLKELQCQLKVNSMADIKVMLTKKGPLSSHLADYRIH